MGQGAAGRPDRGSRAGRPATPRSAASVRSSRASRAHPAELRRRRLAQGDPQNGRGGRGARLRLGLGDRAHHRRARGGRTRTGGSTSRCDSPGSQASRSGSGSARRSCSCRSTTRSGSQRRSRRCRSSPADACGSASGWAGTRTSSASGVRVRRSRPPRGRGPAADARALERRARFRGEHWSFEDATFAPLPEPQPELWVGGGSSGRSAGRASSETSGTRPEASGRTR